MVFYHKGLRVRKTPLPFVACSRKAAILRVQIWSAHESDVVGLSGVSFLGFRVSRSEMFLHWHRSISIRESNRRITELGVEADGVRTRCQSRARVPPLHDLRFQFGHERT